MKNKTLSIILIMFFLLLGSSQKIEAGKVEFIDVKISGYNEGSKVQIKSSDYLGIYDKSKKELVNDLELREIEILIKNNNSGEIFDGNNNYISNLDLNNELIGSISGGTIFINGVEYRGYLGFVNKNGGKILNHLPIKYYLYGVLPREMGGGFPKEALKAQAVASKSYAVVNMNKHINEGFNLCNSTHCQVYGGVSGEHPATNEAVDETIEDYLRYDGKIAEGLFHSNNGGYIESARDVWGGDIPYLISKRDKFSDGTVNSSWELKYTKEYINNKLRASGIHIGDLVDIKIIDKSLGNRVKEMEIIGTSSSQIISGSKFRSIIGTNVLKSTLFEIKRDGDSINLPDKKLYIQNSSEIKEVKLEDSYVMTNQSEISKIRAYSPKILTSRGLSETKMENIEFSGNGDYIISGKGFGHGVGMSQYGAKKMAEIGYDYIDILKHYFEGTEIY